MPKVVGISTDKACQPVNVYGATKMIMERAFANEAVMRSDDNEQKTRFVCVRYGNVIGSTGSVIPLFDRQMRDKGKVTLTSPRMTRFWMSIEEAIDLVLRAADAEDSNGSIFVPLARAMSMLDVALAIAGEPAKIEEIGMRPGEKMDEQLIHYAESLRVRRHDDCFELLPITAEAGTESFTLASHSPNHWMTTEELLNAVEDAREV